MKASPFCLKNATFAHIRSGVFAGRTTLTKYRMTTKTMTTKRLFLLSAGALLALATPTKGSAEEVDVFYMTTTTTENNSYITKLDGSFRLPMVYVADGILKVNYRSIGLADIESIRFEKRREEASAVDEVKSDGGNAIGDSRIFTLDGRRVDNANGRLGKGLYIIGGRKVVAR